LLPPRPPLHTAGSGSDCSSGSNIMKQGRRSSSLEGGNAALSADAAAAPSGSQQIPPRPKATLGKSSSGKTGSGSGSGSGSGTAAPKAAAGSHAGSNAGSVCSRGSTEGGSGRASFSRDAMPEAAEAVKRTPSGSGSGSALHSQNLQKHNQASGARASIESCASRASSTGGHSMRSSFAADAAVDAGELAELDRYGRPSFAAFEDNPKTGRGEQLT
jgi:hypothetical protein